MILVPGKRADHNVNVRPALGELREPETIELRVYANTVPETEVPATASYLPNESAYKIEWINPDLPHGTELNGVVTVTYDDGVPIPFVEDLGTIITTVDQDALDTQTAEILAAIGTGTTAPVDFPDPSLVAEGVDRGDGVLGTGLCDYPSATNVLSGVVYANGTQTGTLMVSNSIDLNNAEKVTSTGCFFLETGGWWVDALDGDVIGEILVSADGETFREPEFTPIVPLYLISGGLYVRAKDAAIPVYV